jgi:hypothetical protein
MPTDSHYLDVQEDDGISFTDLLIWAIVSSRHGLARVIWKHTEYPIHSALLCSFICQKLSELTTSRNDDYTEHIRYFEMQAVAVLDQFDDFELAKKCSKFTMV